MLKPTNANISQEDIRFQNNLTGMNPNFTNNHQEKQHSNGYGTSNRDYNPEDGVYYSGGNSLGNQLGGNSSYEPDNKSITSTPSKISKFTYSG